MSSRRDSKQRKRTQDRVPRRRRDVATVRAEILDAAERRLIVGGASGIRLQDVAADVGISHSNVLHHFGNRDALVAAVIARSLGALHGRIVAAIAASTGEKEQLAAIFESVFEVLAEGGHGRIIFWLALSGHGMQAGSVTLADVVTAAHELRKAKARGKGRAPSREDTAHVVLLASLALAGSAVLFPELLENVGLSAEPAAGARFRAWLAQLLVTHLGFES